MHSLPGQSPVSVRPGWWSAEAEGKKHSANGVQASLARLGRLVKPGLQLGRFSGFPMKRGSRSS